MILAADVEAESRSWLGTPYAHQHREKGFAVDCAGVLIGVARNLRIVASDFDVNGYAPRPDGVQLLEECDRFMTRVGVAQLTPGMALVLKFGADPQHIGMVARYVHGGLSLIHAYSLAPPRGKVVEHRLIIGDAFMRPLIGYALPGVEY